MPRKLDPQTEAALDRAAEASRRASDAVAERDAAILAASQAGASLREIAGAVDTPYMTVKRIIERSRGKA